MTFRKNNSVQIAVAAEKNEMKRLPLKAGDVVYITTYITLIGGWVYALFTYFA